MRRVSRRSAALAGACRRGRRARAGRRRRHRTRDARPGLARRDDGRTRRRPGAAGRARAPRRGAVGRDRRRRRARFALGRACALVLVPMQTLQLLEGHAGARPSCAARWRTSRPEALLAAALADATDCFDEEHDTPPPPDVCEIGDVRYSSQLLAVVDRGDRAAIHRRREIIGPGDRREAHDVVVELDRVSADQVALEAGRLGFIAEPHLSYPRPSSTWIDRGRPPRASPLAPRQLSRGWSASRSRP